MNHTLKMAAIAGMILTTTMAAGIQERAPSAERTVPVCVELGGTPFAQAEPIASKMFASVGVTIEWYVQGRHCPPLAIQVSVSDRTPDTRLPGALAYAVPGQGTRIRLFYDRISRSVPARLLPCLLAHVLVHEITHILEGVCRHSDHGVMKAHWGPKDFVEMSWKPLPFADEDLDLINAGLFTRTARAMWAANQASDTDAAHR